MTTTSRTRLPAGLTTLAPKPAFGAAKTNRLPRGSLHNFASCRLKSVLREIEVGVARSAYVSPACSKRTELMQGNNG